MKMKRILIKKEASSKRTKNISAAMMTVTTTAARLPQNKGICAIVNNVDERVLLTDDIKYDRITENTTIR